MIIFLNGCSSAGKTTIVRALQHIMPDPILSIGIDTFFRMMPPQYVGFGEKAHEGFHFIPDRDDEGPLMRIQNGPFGERVMEAVPHVIKSFIDRGHDLIIDEVLFGDGDLKPYVNMLHQEQVYFIAVHCELRALQERELLRGDRAIGLGRDQIQRVHGPTRFYDLEVDTTQTSAFTCAQEILDYMTATPEPLGFKKLYNQWF